MSWQIIVVLECTGCPAILTEEAGFSGRAIDGVQEDLRAKAKKLGWHKILGGDYRDGRYYCPACAAIMSRERLVSEEVCQR